MARYTAYVVSALVAYLACFIYYIEFDSAAPQIWLKGVELMELYGFEGEEHLSESEDGFVTKIHRLGTKDEARRVALLVPGVHCSSEILFALGPEHDLAYSVYASGVDVWMTNFRGNSNTQPKENTSHTEDELTNFSFHEQGYYDLAATIDYILAYTKQDKLELVTGSMGGNVCLALLASRPEYSKKINKLILLGPTGPFTRTTSILQLVIVRSILASKSIMDYLTSCQRYRPHVSHILCNHPLSPISCWGVTKSYLGFVSENLDQEKSAAVVTFMFSGPYFGMYQHLEQMMAARKYIMRDYGQEENLKRYNSAAAPYYNMSNVAVPIKLYHLVGDVFLTDEARKDMFDLIPNIKAEFEVQPPFGHGNFLANMAVDEDLIQDIVQTILLDKL